MGEDEPGSFALPVWKAKRHPIPTLHLRPVDLERDPGELAALFTLVQDDPSTEAELKEDYDTCKECMLCLNAAEDERGELLGVNRVTRGRRLPQGQAAARARAARGQKGGLLANGKRSDSLLAISDS